MSLIIDSLSFLSTESSINFCLHFTEDALCIGCDCFVERLYSDGIDETLFFIGPNGHVGWMSVLPDLCDMHVTATCYKQTTVVKDSTGETPIFLEPMFIHDNSD
jgi:hypothetical protein